MPYSNLPDAANKIFEKVYNAAITAGKDKEYAAKVGWTAVKNAGYKRSDSGEWVKEESSIFTPEFSMRITKSVFGKDNVMRLQMVASDTEPDSFDERMSLELFNNFIARKNQPVPAAFADMVCEDSWQGGDPYLSLAHYRAGKNGKNLPGMVEESYIDGNYFKSKARLDDNELGRAIFKAINDDLYKTPDRQDKIRVSIAFLDLKHKHGDLVFERNSMADKCPLCAMGAGDKTYLDGYLVHEAFTRVPANPRTNVEVQRMADQILTKKDDARSIVGDLADGLVDKSLADSGLIIRSEEDERDSQPVPTKSEVVEMAKLPAPVAKAVADGAQARDYETSPDKPVDVPEIGFAASNRAATTEPVDYPPADASGGVRTDTETDRQNDVEDTIPSGIVQNLPRVAFPAMDTTFAELKSAVAKAQQSENVEETMKSLVQPIFNKLGDEVRKACTKPDMTSKSSLTAEDVRAIAAEAITQSITEQVLPLFAELKSMVAKSGTPVVVTPNKEQVVQQRSIKLQSRTLTDIVPDRSKPQSIRAIAARSTGLSQ